MKKLIYRHPHIFLEKNVENSKEVVYNWNKLKDDQRGIRDLKGKLEVLPALPSLIKSYKIQARAADFGFDWDTIEGPLSKVLEEYYELVDEIRKDTRDEDRVEEELGDLLLASVNLSRFLNLNPEVALNKANNKFINRLLYMEKTAKELGRSLEEMDLEEMDILWNKSKENLN